MLLSFPLNIKSIQNDKLSFFQEEQDREEEVVDFIEQIFNQRPKGDFESFVRDAVVLSRYFMIAKGFYFKAVNPKIKLSNFPMSWIFI